jgi:DNA-binding NtrC family response regulator
MGYGLGSLSAGSKAAVRTVVLAGGDAQLRERLGRQLTAMRWQVREAAGGAEAMAQLEVQGAEAMVLDSVLPDLEVGEFARQMRTRHPAMDLLWVDGGVEADGVRSPRRNELLQALRQAQQDVLGPSAMGDMAAWAIAPVAVPQSSPADRLGPGGQRARAALQVAALLLRSRSLGSPDTGVRGDRPEGDAAEAAGGESAPSGLNGLESAGMKVLEEAFPLLHESAFAQERPAKRPRALPLPEMVGESFAMLELARLVRLVAPRSATVLIEGDTGTGKELVAKAVHRLSARAAKPFLVLNCAAIPEALLEAELFGHTRGAFTGAVQSRTGRIEAANGGTLFLDEIGEMPMALQAKMLRFLESGELQRVGDNETVRVDVRVVAASHQPLQLRATQGKFRLDLYHRLAVFPVFVPALRSRMGDVLPLAAYLLGKLGEEMPVKRLSAGAATRLMEHDWPGNVRELAHVLERGAILAEDRREIASDEIWF